MGLHKENYKNITNNLKENLKKRGDFPYGNTVIL